MSEKVKNPRILEMTDVVRSEDTGHIKWLGTTKIGHAVGLDAKDSDSYMTLCGKTLVRSKATEREAQCKQCTTVKAKADRHDAMRESSLAERESLETAPVEAEMPTANEPSMVDELAALYKEWFVVHPRYVRAQGKVGLHQELMRSASGELGGVHKFTAQMRKQTSGMLTRNQLANAKYRAKRHGARVEQIEQRIQALLTQLGQAADWPTEELIEHLRSEEGK